MKKLLLLVVFSMVLLGNDLLAQRDDGDISFRNRQVFFKINFTGIGAAVEYMPTQPFSINVEGGVGITPIMFPIKTIAGDLEFAFYPYVKPGLRYYFNMIKREKKGYFMQKPNAAYVALNFAYFFPIPSNENMTIYRIAPAVGVQAAINRLMYLDMSIGAGYVNIDDDGGFSFDLFFGIGIWL